MLARSLPSRAPSCAKYAPKMFSMTIHVDKIRDVIGKGGKVIQKICADFDVQDRH